MSSIAWSIRYLWALVVALTFSQIFAGEPTNKERVDQAVIGLLTATGIKDELGRDSDCGKYTYPSLEVNRLIDAVPSSEFKPGEREQMKKIMPEQILKLRTAVLPDGRRATQAGLEELKKTYKNLLQTSTVNKDVCDAIYKSTVSIMQRHIDSLRLISTSSSKAQSPKLIVTPVPQASMPIPKQVETVEEFIGHANWKLNKITVTSTNKNPINTSSETSTVFYNNEWSTKVRTNDGLEIYISRDLDCKKKQSGYELTCVATVKNSSLPILGKKEQVEFSKLDDGLVITTYPT